MNKSTSPPNKIPWPPILYITSIILAYMAEQQWGSIWLDGYHFNILPSNGIGAYMTVIAGIAIIGLGLGLDFYALITLRNHQTTILPTKAASKLVTSGPYLFSRNPIYLGNTLITLGLSLFFENLWYIFFGLIAAYITNELVIKREERHLLQLFGNEWKSYTKKVRRWL